MSWYPITFLPLQHVDSSGKPYSGAVLKAYAAGTTTPLPFATDYLGTTLTAEIVLNASGYPTYNGTIVIPHVQENLKLALYPNEAAADANSGALWTVDNIQIAEAENDAFFQAFDGDDSTTTFTLSMDMGTEEANLMVFADRKLTDLVSNGSFSTDTIWTKGANWTIGAGVATAATATSDLTQNANTPLIAGQNYNVSYTVTRSAGSVTPVLGGTAGTARSAAGTYTETIIAGSTQAITFTGAGFTGTIDNVTVKPVAVSRREILRPDEFTIVGNQLTLVEPAGKGTKTVLVFAPSKLLGAAAKAAAAAATSEANAAAYNDSAAIHDSNAAASALVAEGWAEAAGSISVPNGSITTIKLGGDITAAGKALLDDASAAAQRTTLGLGTAATQNTGTSGATIPLLNGNNTWGGTNNYTAEIRIDPSANIGQVRLSTLSAADNGALVLSSHLGATPSRGAYTQLNGINTAVAAGSAFYYCGTGGFHVFRDTAASDLFVVRSTLVSSPVIDATTTANAANMYIASGGVMYRSTSNEAYKTDIETMDAEIAKNIVKNGRAIWYRSADIPGNGDPLDLSWYSFGAQQLSEIDPRLVIWGYMPEDYETVETGQFEDAEELKEVTVERQVIRVIDGVATLVTETATEMQQVFDILPLYHPDGSPVTVEVASENEVGETVVIEEQASYRVPRTYKKPVTERRLRANAVKKPVDVQTKALLAALFACVQQMMPSSEN